MITGLGHIALRTRNLEETARFYREVLGFPEAFRMYDDAGNTTTCLLYTSVMSLLQYAS